jgi:hypothetical protein
MKIANKYMLQWAMMFAFFLFVTMGSKAHAACTGITGGMTQTQVVSAVTACNAAGGGVINATAGTYGPFSSAFTLPCAVSIAGPTIAYSQTHYQTAIFVGSSGFSGVPIHTTAGCSVSQSISYLEWNGEQSSGSGGFIYITAGTNHLVINNNFMHGATGVAYPGNTSEAQIYFAGTGTNLSNPSQNVSILNNEFGPEGSAADCGAAMTETNTEGGGGYCAGVLFNGYVKNILVDGNNFQYLEQGVKVIEATTNGGSTQNSGNTNGLTLTHNWFQQIQRIPFETQSNYYTTAFPTVQTINYNLFGNRYNGSGGQQNFDLSVANGCGNPPSSPLCTANADYNADIQNVNNSTHGAGNEFWGDSNSHASGWIFEGYIAGAGGAIDWAQSGQFAFNNEIFNITSGSGTNCVSQTGGYWNHEDSPAYTPTCTGNTYSSTGTGTYTSPTPTITPTGSFTGSQTVVLTNPGTGIYSNTSIWYTTDGSTPAAGTATLYTGSFAVTATTTVKALGMWGSPNQPYSYPSSYGFVPSAVVSATYTTTGSPGSIVSGYLSTSPTNGVNTATVGASTIQFIPVVNYSGGSTNVPISPSSCSWATLSGGTSIFSVSSAGVLTPLGAGSDNIVATCSSIALSQWTVVVSAAAGPSLVSMSVYPNVVYSTVPVALSAVGTYSDGSVKTVTGATWISGNTSVLTIDSSGNVTPVGTGSSVITASISGITAQSAVVIPPNANPVPSNFPFSANNFGCFVFQRLTVGTYTLVVNADGSFTVTP